MANVVHGLAKRIAGAFLVIRSSEHYPAALMSAQIKVLKWDCV
jgi:hypothetical protein